MIIEDCFFSRSGRKSAIHVLGRDIGYRFPFTNNISIYHHINHYDLMYYFQQRTPKRKQLQSQTTSDCSTRYILDISIAMYEAAVILATILAHVALWLHYPRMLRFDGIHFHKKEWCMRSHTQMQDVNHGYIKFLHSLYLFRQFFNRRRQFFQNFRCRLKSFIDASNIDLKYYHKHKCINNGHSIP